MKSSHKITLLFTALVTAILLVVSFSVYYFNSLERKDMFKKRLKSRANNNAQIFTYFLDSNRTVLNRINTSSLESLPHKSVGIYNVRGIPLYEYNADDAQPLHFSRDHIQQVIHEGESFFVIDEREVYAVHYTEERNPIIVAVAAYDMDGWTQLKGLKQIFIAALLVGAFIALITGRVFSRQLLKPVVRLIREVNDISSHNLSHRIYTGKTQDELSQLATTFNELLDRLQESFISQRRFISNASHELSTPLTSVSSQLQVALQRERSIEEYHQVMQSIQEDVVQMRQLTKSLLEIAKTGSEGSIELNEVRIDETLFKVMADVKRISPNYKVQLQFSDLEEFNFLVFGNSDLLYIAVKNIVENGCKFSPDHTSEVSLAYRDGQVIIEVSNNGETIPEGEREQIFQPFYRSASASGIGGFGLGLALAKRIIGLHKGAIFLESGYSSGTTFIIHLPSYHGK
ncbi:MAG TPA: ATP-binding protein [Flavitalea sp.]|mgnify:CR=1 FL=1|nr:ATP-binding protein [Flavitalea sp.]